jgi:hypothetical protein
MKTTFIAALAIVAGLSLSAMAQQDNNASSSQTSGIQGNTQSSGTAGMSRAAGTDRGAANRAGERKRGHYSSKEHRYGRYTQYKHPMSKSARRGTTRY